MVERRNRLLTTVTVTGSQIVMTAEGATALALTMKESGTVAFVLSRWRRLPFSAKIWRTPRRCFTVPWEMLEAK